MRWFAALRTAVYMSGFVVLWGWAAVSVRRYDATLGTVLPAWVSPLGWAVMVCGFVLALICGANFAFRGRGTPVPFDPPLEFVAAGPYRYVRNPMYLGALALLAGYGLVVGSVAVLILSGGAWVLAHTFVVLVEEPGLRRRFGDSYERYTRSVMRWVPRFRRNLPPGSSHGA
jgi:protein-S-isoprenylcysteine O-methyltransferase Ste14